MSIGKVFICTEQIGSTNAWAAKWVQEGLAVHGMAFYTRVQTAGRGQMGNVWLAQPGKDAAFSIVLMPGFLAVTDQFYLNIALSLAVQKTLVPIVGSDLRIKWPNDIYVKDKKLGGILIENTLTGTQIGHSIAGIGINVNGDINSELLPNATSLKAITGKEWSAVELIHSIAANMKMYYDMLQRQGTQWAVMKEAYLSVLYKYGMATHFRANDKDFTATVYGITHAGKLLLQHTDGTINAYGFKEVAWV